MKDELLELLNDPLFQPNSEEQALFELTPAMAEKTKEKMQADFVAQRRPCENFEQYEPLFKQVHEDLRTGRRRLAKFAYTSLKAGNVLLIGGVLVYIAEVYEDFKPDSSHVAFDGRTLTIYENGTESNVMLQTLGKAAYSDGYTITQPDEVSENELRTNMGVQEGDKKDGYIYVLSSLSKNPEIASVKDLYKIGFSTTPVEQRIANAENEPTYLCDKVKIEAVWSTYNLKTEVLETLIHQFFHAVQFQVRIRDKEGNTHTPKEWYVVPLPMIEKAINSIIDGTITRYKYNPTLQLIEETPEKDHLKAGEFDTKGWRILTLNIKKKYFQEIATGEKLVEYRKLKESNLNKHTWVDPNDGKRYLREFDALRLKVMDSSKQYMIVEVKNTLYDPETQIISYYLGKILTVDMERIDNSPLLMTGNIISNQSTTIMPQPAKPNLLPQLPAATSKCSPNKKYIIPIDLQIYSNDDELLWEGFNRHTITQKQVDEIIEFILKGNHTTCELVDIPGHIHDEIFRILDKVVEEIIDDGDLLLPDSEYYYTTPKYLPKELLALFGDEVISQLDVSGVLDTYGVETIDELLPKKKIASAEKSTKASKPKSGNLCMKTLAICQPWASLIACGVKDIECRNAMRTKCGKIFVAASSTKIPWGQLPPVVQDVLRQLESANILPPYNQLPTKCIIGHVDIVDVTFDQVESIWGRDWDGIKYVLRNAHVLDRPLYGLNKATPYFYNVEGYDEEHLPASHIVDLSGIELPL